MTRIHFAMHEVKYGAVYGLYGSPYQVPHTTRNDLAQYLASEHLNLGVEIGVFKGEFAEELCLTNPDLRLIGIDPWIPYPEYVDQRQSTMNRLPRIYEEARERLANVTCQLVRQTSADAAPSFLDRSLDFVFIDGNHALPYVLEDLETWSQKVRSGGIVSGHDYHHFTRPPYRNIHVIEGVNIFTAKHQIQPWFLLEDGTFLWVNP